MARPEKNTVDYFPFICNEGASTNFIESKYQNDGFATWVKILRELAKSPHHYLDLTVKKNLMNILGKCHLSEDKFFIIVDDLCDLEEFDYELWHQQKVIWSETFIINIEDAYLKRKNKILDIVALKSRLSSFRMQKLGKIDQNSGEKPHIIPYHTIIEDSILPENNNSGINEVIFLSKEEEALKKTELLRAEIWIESSCMQLQISADEFRKKVDDFFDEIRNTGDLRKAIPELQKHYFYWIRKKINGNNNNTKHGGGITKVITPKGFDGL